MCLCVKGGNIVVVFFFFFFKLKEAGKIYTRSAAATAAALGRRIDERTPKPAAGWGVGGVGVGGRPSIGSERRRRESSAAAGAVSAS